MKIKLYYVFILLVALIILIPLFQVSLRSGIVLNALYTIVFIIVMYNLARGITKSLYLIIVGVPWIILGWLGMVLENDFWIELAGATFMVLFFGYTGTLIFKYIAKSKEVTADTFSGAACIYMFIGLTWTGVYTAVELIRPLSFQISSDSTYQITRVSELIYFSFTTLTTLGYGDISPATSMAQSLAILEAMTGVLYMALIIGMLVGIYSSSSKRKSST